MVAASCSLLYPSDLRRDIFAAYHAAPTTGHMKFYKTLHRIRMRFFWPKLRTDVSDWCKQCAHCVATNTAVRRNNELLFSWPISTPFFILHVDLWEPGKTTSKICGSTRLLAAMCDLTGFVLSQSTNAKTADALAELFMRHFLLKVGLCGLVVVDADSKFRSTFESMCKILGIRFHAAARGNHKAVSVERYFRVLNKAVTIGANDRGTNAVFVEVAQCTEYAWNSSVIDGTDIIRSVAAVGREFKFPLDLILSAPPQPVDADVSAVHNYLRLAQNQSKFSTEILKILIEDRRSYHRERMNQSRNQKLFQLGDIVMVRVSVQSKAAEDRVAKLSYRLRGPYEITSVSGHGAYNVRKLGMPDGAELTYHAENISLLPPVLRPVEPLDGPDLRYMNAHHPPIPHPLKDAFNIKLYNETWFSTPLHSEPPNLNPVPDREFSVDLSTGPSVNTQPDAPTPDAAAALFQAITASRDRLFFVAFRPDGTLRAQWYLVSVDLEQTALESNCVNAQSTGTFYVHFYTRHPADHSETDVTTRWWPEWHEYTIDNDIIEYGKKIIIYPTVTPDPSRVIAWAQPLNLCNPATYLLGPFDFQDPALNPPGRSPSFRQYVPSTLWTQLAELCVERGVVPPHLVQLQPSSATNPRRRRRR